MPGIFCGLLLDGHNVWLGIMGLNNMIFLLFGHDFRVKDTNNTRCTKEKMETRSITFVFIPTRNA